MLRAITVLWKQREKIFSVTCRVRCFFFWSAVKFLFFGLFLFINFYILLEVFIVLNEIKKKRKYMKETLQSVIIYLLLPFKPFKIYSFMLFSFLWFIYSLLRKAIIRVAHNHKLPWRGAPVCSFIRPRSRCRGLQVLTKGEPLFG